MHVGGQLVMSVRHVTSKQDSKEYNCCFNVVFNDDSLKRAFLDAPSYDTSRVAAQIVSGISFIGGGIIFTRDKKVSGITTAAGIWATAGIGMAFGADFWIFGSFCSFIVVLV